LVLVLKIATDLKFVVELLVFHVCIISACGGGVNNFLRKFVLSVIILIAEEADACPIVSLDSLDESSQPCNGNMTRNIVGQANEIAIASHDGNLHRSGVRAVSFGLTAIPHIVVLAVVVRANTDGESVAAQILDLEAVRFVQAGHSGFRVFHAYSISYWGSGVYSEDGFIFIYKWLCLLGLGPAAPAPKCNMQEKTPRSPTGLRKGVETNSSYIRGADPLVLK